MLQECFEHVQQYLGVDNAWALAIPSLGPDAFGLSMHTSRAAVLNIDQWTVNAFQPHAPEKALLDRREQTL